MNKVLGIRREDKNRWERRVYKWTKQSSKWNKMCDKKVDKYGMQGIMTGENMVMWETV